MTKWLGFPLRLGRFMAYFARVLVAANVQVFRDVLTPAQLSSPRIVAFDSRCRDDLEITLLSILITLTPGTLVLATKRAPEDDETPFLLFVHAMYAETDQEALDGILDNEQAIIGLTRGGT